MPIQITTSITSLMQKAHTVGKAKIKGDPKKIKIAEENLESYKQLVLKSDKVMLNITRGSLGG